MSEENKAIVRRLYEEVWNLGDLDVLEDIVSADFVGHRSGQPDDLGPEAVRESVVALCEAFPDGRFTIEDMVVEGDRVAVRFTGRATHRGEFRGVQPTGRQITVTGIGIYRIYGGQIVERWENIDQLGLLQQLVAVPAVG